MSNLEEFVRVYDDFIPKELCDSLVSRFEQQKQKQILNGKTVRNHLPNSQWHELDIGKLLTKEESDYLINRMFAYKKKYDQDCKLEPELPMPGQIDQLIMKRYDPNGEDNFELHFDSLGPVSTRYLVILWYLNDVEEGGETCFPRLDIAIKPKAGRLLIFPPYWLFMHEAKPPISDAKYIASTYFHW